MGEFVPTGYQLVNSTPIYCSRWASFCGANVPFYRYYRLNATAIRTLVSKFENHKDFRSRLLLQYLANNSSVLRSRRSSSLLHVGKQCVLIHETKERRVNFSPKNLASTRCTSITSTRFSTRRSNPLCQ